VFGIGVTELLIILGIMILIFGGKKIAGLGKGVGECIKEFRHAFKDADEVTVEIAKEVEQCRKKKR